MGNLSRFLLTGGERNDITQAPDLIDSLPKVGAIIADKAFDADHLLEHIARIGSQAVIPPRTHRRVHRPFDRHRYKSRNLIERFFLRLKHFRRIATRYDKLAVRFEAFISIVAAFIWLA